MAGKRGYSEGSIRRRADGRWEARYRDVDGKRQSLYGKTRQEVARELHGALRDRERGVHVLSDHQTVGDYLTSWLQSVKKLDVRPSSYLSYSFDVRRHLIPALGHHQLAKLTAQHIQAFLASQLAKGCAASSVRHRYVVLHGALEHALELGLVLRNVADMVKPPRAKRHEFDIYDEEQANKLLDAVAGDRLEALLVLALATGMREGELDTLQWRDVDLEGGYLTVRRTLQRTEDGPRMDEPKTTHGRRRIILPEVAIEALRRHRARQAEERIRLGEAWQDHGFIFTNAIGERLPRDYFDARRWYGAVVRRAGLPMIRFHDLRHTAATLLLERGVNIQAVSEMLGHSSITITLALYGHVTPRMQQEAATTMDRILRSWGSNRGSKPKAKASEER